MILDRPTKYFETCASTRENRSSVFTNRHVQSQKQARWLKVWLVEEELFYPSSEKKALISCAVSAQLICAFVFADAKIRFSHDAAHIIGCT